MGKRFAKKKAKRSRPRKGVAAQYSGRCAACEREWVTGTPIAQWGEEWMHVACVDAKRATAQILAGDTFAGHQGGRTLRAPSNSGTRKRR